MLLIQWADQTFELHAEKAVYWRQTRTLLIADPHFGKAAAFRHAGIPVPEDVTAADTARLSRLLFRTAAERLIVLGDLLHAQAAHNLATLAGLERWRARHRELDAILVEGNHDRRAGQPPAHLTIRTVTPPLVEKPLAFVHEPVQHEGMHVLAGHIHPGVVLRDPAGPGLRAACFVFDERLAMLPAFGSFTGSHKLRPKASQRIFVVGPDAVVAMPSRAGHT